MLNSKVWTAAVATALISFGCATDDRGPASAGQGHPAESTSPTTTTGSHDVGGSGREHISGTTDGQDSSSAGATQGGPTSPIGSHDVGGSDRRHIHQ